LNYLQDIGCTEAEVKTVVSNLEAKSLLTHKTACVLQVIRSVSFYWKLCPLIVLQAHLQKNNLDLEIAVDKPVLF